MKTTYFPCVKGTLGDWTYYITVMGVAEVVRYVQFAEEVCPNKDLDSMIQREVSNRSKDIADYLRTNEQRFFGSLIVAAYGGEPRFLPISFSDAPLMTKFEGSVGVLQFDGTEQYYALDGQHRLAALRLENERNPERYEPDQISMIVICHTKDNVGMTRARRLFTTVNRYAKKTSPATHTAMSEDDGVAITTRRLIREHPLFKQRIKVMIVKNGKTRIAAGNAMSSADHKYLMAIETFRKCNRHLLPSDLEEEFSHEQQTPSFESLERAFETLKARWDKMIKGVAPWKELLDPSASLEQFRHSDGGHVLVRPIAITAFVKAFASAPDSVSVQHLRSVVDHFQDLASAPWGGLLWNSGTQKMTVTVEAERLASRLWRYLMGLDENRGKLQDDWKAAVDPQNERRNVKLPTPPN